MTRRRVRTGLRAGRREAARHPHVVLVVDDDGDLRESVVRYLETMGVHAVGAPGGPQALALLRGGLPACLIILDMRMPAMDGFAFREAQIGDPAIADIPVILFSAEPVADGRAHRLGLDTQITKPVEPERIAELVDRHCAHPESASADEPDADR